MNDLSDTIAEMYNSNPDYEYNRLDKNPFNSLEYYTTIHFIKKYIKSGSKVLDAGSGPGRYLNELLNNKFKSTLLDLSNGNIETAKSKIKQLPKELKANIERLIVGDIRNMHMLEKNSFDAVLCLGAPISHIPDLSERIEAISELVRVVKENSFVFLTAVGYYSAIKTYALNLQADLLIDDFDLLNRTGDSYVMGNKWHFYKANELKSQAEECGLEIIEMVGCESLSANIIKQTNSLANNPEQWDKWKEIIIEHSTNPSVVDNSNHILLIGKKRSNV